MKNILIGALLAFGLNSVASAIPFYAEYADNVWLNKNNKSHTWVFDLDNDPLFEGWFFGPYGSVDINPEDTINSAFFSIGFYDDEKDWKRKEYGTLIVDDDKWFKNEEISFSDSILLADVASSLQDHVLTVTVKRKKGDFGVNFASLFGDFTDNPAGPTKPPISVTEPSIVLMLGSGLLLLAFARRRVMR